jgi:hypothetical protein
MADVFISHIHEQALIATAVQRYPKTPSSETNVFLSSDQWQVLAGENWLYAFNESYSLPPLSFYC